MGRILWTSVPGLTPQGKMPVGRGGVLVQAPRARCLGTKLHCPNKEKKEPAWAKAFLPVNREFLPRKPW